jgi:hypothetical protein
LRSDLQGDRLWRWLLHHKEVVILVDGLDEMLTDRAEEERKAAIKGSLREAAEDELLLVATCRNPQPGSHPLGGLRPQWAETRVARQLEAIHQQSGEHLDRSLQIPPAAKALIESSERIRTPFFLDLLAEVSHDGRVDGLSSEGDEEHLLVGLLDEHLDRAQQRSPSPNQKRHQIGSLELAACAMVIRGTEAIDISDISQMDVAHMLATEYDFDTRHLLHLVDGATRLRVAEVWERAGHTRVQFRDRFIRDYFAARALADVNPKRREAMPLREFLGEHGARTDVVANLDRMQAAHDRSAPL